MTERASHAAEEPASASSINKQHLRSLECRACLGLLATLAVKLLVAYFLFLLLQPFWPSAAGAYLAAEAAFLFIWHRRRKQLDAIPECHAPDEHDGMTHFKKWHSSSSYNAALLHIGDLLQHHGFAGVPLSQIGRGNAAELVARGYFYKTLGELDAEGKAHLVDEMLQAIEEVWEFRFEDGFNPALQCQYHLQEPLKVFYRPLMFYLLCECSAAMKHLGLLAAGFRGHTYGSYTYYTYNLPTEDEAAHGCDASEGDRHPIVFLHGVGAGLLPYIPFLLRVTALGRPVMAVEYKHLSMRWTDFIPTAPQVAADMSSMFSLHGIHKASLIAHSYGTFYTTCLLKLNPERVHAVCLIDPVTCCMWSGHLINNFVYNPGRSSITGLITWLIARDIHTATSVSRNFFWTDVNMWPEHVPHRAVVVLGGQDELVPVKHVEAMLRHETSAKVLMQPEFQHADFLLSPSWQDNILSHFAEMVQQPPHSSSSIQQTFTPCQTAASASGAAAVGPVTPSPSLNSCQDSGSLSDPAEPDTTITISSTDNLPGLQATAEIPTAQQTHSPAAAKQLQSPAAAKQLQLQEAGNRADAAAQLDQHTGPPTTVSQQEQQQQNEQQQQQQEEDVHASASPSTGKGGHRGLLWRLRRGKAIAVQQ